MSATVHRTILFVDVVASVELYADLGDADARARMAPCLDRLTALIGQHGGTVVKSLGDGILAAFDAEAAAVDAARTMVPVAEAHGLQVSVGVHAGEVLVEEDDVFGQAVNTASRLSALARPSEILVTPHVIECLPDGLRASARPLHNVAVKGFAEPVKLFAIGDESPAATMSMAAGTAAAAFGLVLRLGDRSWKVDTRSTVHLGRDSSNEVVVAGNRVSRRHAVIAYRRGKFVLADQSVNGTWVVSDDGSTDQLLREEVPLHGSGAISLGVPADHPLADPITYMTLTAP